MAMMRTAPAAPTAPTAPTADGLDGTGGWPFLIAWRGWAVARLKAGEELLRPAAEPLFSQLLETPDRDRVRRRLRAWLDGHVGGVFVTLSAALKADLAAPARGIVYRLSENLGSIGRAQVEAQIESLGRAGRKSLRPFGIRIGRHLVFMPELLKPRAIALRGLLWALRNGFDNLPPPPPPGRVSLCVARDAPQGFYQAMGYVPFGRLAVRADIAERLASVAWALARKGPFPATPALLSLAGCGTEEMTAILAGLGYRGQKNKAGELRFRHASKPRTKVKKEARKKLVQVDRDSPFTKLQDLAVGR